MQITIAGASGFVGKNLISKIDNAYEVIGLSRSPKSNEAKLKWRQADLFSFQSTVQSLIGTDIAIYLVHSMLPSSKLFQGSFRDTDLLLADNFAKACASNGVKRIIYLGGLVPNDGSSEHLESRKEVEDVLKTADIPVTILRAGMVVGEGGSSFEILRNLVVNLPIMVLPKWTKSTTQAIFIDDLVRIITKSIESKEFENKTIDVVNGEVLSYEDLIKQASKHFRKNQLMLPVPINYTSFSKLWVKFFGESDYELVSPLIDSLLCNLPTPPVSEYIKDLIEYKSFKDMLEDMTYSKKESTNKKKVTQENTVRSIQRLENPKKLDEFQICEEYINWLPRYMKSLITAKKSGNQIHFVLLGIESPLLVLERMKSEINYLDRVKFHIVGGILSKTKDTGWLEFRSISNGKYTLASINEFVPSLPWYLYKYSQAPAHAFVMRSFGKYLVNKSSR